MRLPLPKTPRSESIGSLPLARSRTRGSGTYLPLPAVAAIDRLWQKLPLDRFDAVYHHASGKIRLLLAAFA